MAKPIRNTPILFGEDATEFLRKINTPTPEDERKKLREKMNKSVSLFKQRVKIEI
ncbi:MAG: hypothetical protein HUK14_09185 [Muribaculaceae bacterium]|nr:hypothetical protein [Muribaculaceae bacterium]